MAIFLIDAQLPPGLARSLREIGHGAVHVQEIGMDSASDLEIAKAAATRGAILVSKDEDFFVMVQLGEIECPLLWIRVGNTTNAALWQALLPDLPQALDAFANGEKIVELV